MKFLILTGAQQDATGGGEPSVYGGEWVVEEAEDEDGAIKALIKRGGVFRLGEEFLISPVPMLSVHKIDGFTLAASVPDLSQ